jgi:putative acyl-CoA dehydrogenase
MAPSLSPLGTHEVLNQPQPLINYNLFQTDRALAEALHREGAGWAEKLLQEFGQKLGTEEVIHWGFQANENVPVLHTHDRFGNRIDEVEFHPAWHNLMHLSVQLGIHSLPWREKKDGAHVARAAFFMLSAENEMGHLCPISMTYSIIPALRKQPNLAMKWESKILSSDYDPRFLPASQKKGLICGMAMTEKQGGSDVRANTTRAEPVGGGGSGEEYAITGHKWFCSAPMSDAFLVLAQAPKGLSCFLLPRWKSDETKNAIYIQRLKDKLGNRSNASSEVEFLKAQAWMVGEEGRGVPTIIEMVNHTRLDCVIAAAAHMRQALVQAMHHVYSRDAFGKKLIDQSLMKMVLADLSVESEAATMLMMRLARTFDRRQEDGDENLLGRLLAPVAKYYLTKRAIAHVAEALECLGGAGYVEESVMARMYRETPLYSIWEGSGNVICLDVLRAIIRQPESLSVFLGELEKTKGMEPALDALINNIKSGIEKFRQGEEGLARLLVENMAIAFQGSLLVRQGHPAITKAFIATRIKNQGGYLFGAIAPDQIDTTTILERAWVE